MTGIKRHKKAIILGIVALVAANIWRWWPAQPASAARSGAIAAGYHAEDFEVKALPADTRMPMARDLFHPKRIASANPAGRALPVRAVQAPQSPAKPPEPSAHDTAQAELAQIRCLGISVREQRIQAYMVSGGEPQLVSAGDKVGSRFVVEKIVPEGVMLRDNETGVSGQIAVSGK